jgi:hypothetical protein
MPGDPTVNDIVSQPLAFAMLHWITRLSDTLPAAFVAGALSLLLVLFTGTGIMFFRSIVRAWLRRQGGRCDHPYYRLGVIPAAVDGTEPIATFGPVATLVATAKLDAAIAAALTEAVLQSVAAICGSLPALAELDCYRMGTDALSAPQHPGAKRAVAELGLNR